MAPGDAGNDPDPPPELVYDLRCTVCEYSEVVEGSTDDVYAAVDAHVDAYERSAEDHFVEFERRNV